MNGLFDPIFSGFEVILFMLTCFTMGMAIGKQETKRDSEDEN